MLDTLTFGEALTLKRKRKRLPMHELSRLAGISASQICRVETGTQTPTPRFVAALAKALDWNLADALRASACLPDAVLALIPETDGD